MDTTLTALRTYNGHFPRQAVEAAINFGETLRPHLLTMLKECVAAASPTVTDENWQTFAVVTHLLCKMRASEAFPSLIAVCSLPDDVTDALFEDAVSDVLPKYLASTFNGDFAALRNVALNEAVDGYVRGAAITTYLLLYKNKLIVRNDLISTFKELFTELHQDASYVVLTSLVCDAVTIHGTELLAEIRNAFAGGHVDATVISLREAEEILGETSGEALEAFHEDGSYDFIDDPITEMEWWGFWQENRPQPTPKTVDVTPVARDYTAPKKSVITSPEPTGPHHNENRDIGRNDPCPCASGKKYKKCCLGKAATTATTTTLSQHKRLDAAKTLTINKLIEKGYRCHDDKIKCCSLWWKAWETLKPNFTAEMRCSSAVDEVFDGDRLYSDWVFDLSTSLVNAALDDKTYAVRGVNFLKEYLAQFPDDEPENVRSFNADLAEFYCLAGDFNEGERTALSMIKKWPNHAVGYVAMAEISERRPNVDDMSKHTAQVEWLEKAKAVPVIDADDFDLDARLEGVRHRR